VEASLQGLLATSRRIPRDVVLAAGLLVAAQVELLVVGPVPHRLVVTLAAVGLTVSFVWWDRWPLLVLAAVMTTS
jgi:hypothetical protein